jgi:hypothetical protein
VRISLGSNLTQKTMKNGDYQELRALCGAAGKQAQDLQPEASVARDAAARSRRKLFWKVLGGTGSAVVAIAVLAVDRGEPAPSVAQTPAPSVAAAAGGRVSRVRETRLHDHHERPKRLFRCRAGRRAAGAERGLAPAPLAETAPPVSRAASQATTQAEKELEDSQPDGSC